MDDIYFDGDPEVDSTRRHMERVLQGRPSRRWPWIAAVLAGGAFAFWRIRARRAKARQDSASAEPAPPPGDGPPAG